MCIIFIEMLTDTDKEILEQTEITSKLFDAFVQQRKLRCDLFVRYWVFEFLCVHKDYPEKLPEEYYVFVDNLHDPDNLSEEFCKALNKIHEQFKDHNIIPRKL